MLIGWLLCLVAVTQTTAEKGPVWTAYEWKYIDFLWNNESHKAAVVAAGKYDATKIAPLDVDRWQRKTFVTSINGGQNPGTLSTVTREKGPGGYLLRPYPDWSWHEGSDCNRIISVYRVTIDKCDRLWVLDTGKIGDEQTCPAKLLVFDLHTDRLLEKIEIPNEYSQNSKTKVGLLVTPVVETYGPQCRSTIVYMADPVGRGLVVYDGTKFWRLDSSVYDADPRYANFTIENESFELEDGVLGMALQQTYEGPPTLWFRSLSSVAMNNVKTSELKRAQSGAQNIAYQSVDNFLPSQAAAMAISLSGTLFYVLTKETAIGCYNVHRPFNKDNAAILVRDPVRLQFGSGVKIIPARHTGREEEVWIFTNRLQKIYSGTMDYKNDVNFRILKASTRRLVSNGICKRPRRAH